jgi:hypothetical protein
MAIKLDMEKFKKYAISLALDVMKDSAFEIRDEIRQSMVDSPEWTEKTYYRQGRKHHPSQPGNPPRVDYGRLHDSMSVNWYGSGMAHGEVGGRAESSDGVSEPGNEGLVVIGTNAPSNSNQGYLLWELLEIGTRKMKARPFLMAPLQKYKKIVEKHLREMSTKKYILGLAKKFK